MYVGGLEKLFTFFYFHLPLELLASCSSRGAKALTSENGQFPTAGKLANLSPSTIMRTALK